MWTKARDVLKHELTIELYNNRELSREEVNNLRGLFAGLLYDLWTNDKVRNDHWHWLVSELSDDDAPHPALLIDNQPKFFS
jgi:hypothetical protein